MKHYRLQEFPPCPNSLCEFAAQLNAGGYCKVLDYDTNSVTSINVVDSDGFTHLLFYDLDLIKRNCGFVTHMFIDGTFKTRPRIKDCTQLLNVLVVIHNRVSLAHFYDIRKK